MNHMTRWQLPSRADIGPTPWGWLGLLTLLALALRVIGLDSGLWYDEIITLVESVRSPLGTILTVFPGNNQHTFFSVLAHLSVGAFGEHAWSLRLPAMVIGVATVPMLFFFAREFVGRTEALLTSLLLAVAYHHVWFSQNARGYSALAFLTVMSSWLLLRGLRRGKTIDWVWYAVAAALGVYTHLTMVFLVVSHFILCLMSLGLPVDRERRQTWQLPLIGFVLSALFTLLLYAPVLLEVQQFFVEEPSPQGVATPRWALLELLRGLNIGVGTGVAAAIGGALLALGLWSYLRQSLFILGLFLLPGAVTVAATVALGRPIFPRFVFFLVGFGLLIVVRGALTAGRLLSRTSANAPGRVPAMGVALVLAMVASSLVALIPNYRYPKQDFEGAMRFVDERRADGEPVFTAGLTTEIYRDYHGRTWDAVESLDELQAVRARGRRVWGLYTMEGYIALSAPDMMRTIRAECKVEGVFRGTVGGGDVTVCAFP
jgi:mannosyltransferase